MVAQWYALRVRPRHEKVVDAILGNKGYERFLPLYKCLRRRSDRYKEIEFPLFSGYIFCQFDVIGRMPILTTPGVIGIVGVGRVPAPIATRELDAIGRMIAAQAAVEPWPYLQCGQSVAITSGPLRGIAGILLRTGSRSRLVVSVTLLQRSVAVEVDRSWVTRAGCRDIGSGVEPRCLSYLPPAG